MRWILGVDLSPRSHGAVQFARWLAQATNGADEFVAVHVLSTDHLQAVLKYHHLDEIVDEARAAAEREIGDAWRGAPGATPVVEVVQAPTVEDGRESARARHRAEGLLMGRAASAAGIHLVRLGRAVRRVLRNLATPVVIAPPELALERVGDGPVTALSTMTDDSVDACRFAAALAARTGRPFAVAHVVRDPRAGAAAQLSSSTLDMISAELAAAARVELAKWIAANDLSPALTSVPQGDVLSCALDFSDAHHVPLVAVGARGLSSLERVFSPSLGRDLAASSRVPIAVVPPQHPLRAERSSPPAETS